MSDINEAFGSLLRESRTEAGFTQAELGVRVGLGRTAITNIESGKQSVSLQQVYEFSNALGIAVQQLLPQITLQPNEQPAPAVGSLVADADDQRLLMTLMKRQRR